MVAVTYHCPHCGALAELQRDGYLADRSVTPTPLDGWSYAAVGEDYDDADGVVVRCGGPATVEGGCDERFYLSFVRFERGRRVEP